MVQPPLMIDQLLVDSCDSSDIFAEEAKGSYNKSSFLGQNRRNISAYERSEGEIAPPRDNGRVNELAQAYEFEENKALDEVEKPLYDSSDGPVARGGKNARGKGDVFVSGDSFGGRGAF